MSLPEAFLDEIRSRIPVSAIVGKVVKLTRRGREFVGCCPFHAEKTPSFTVNDEKEFWHCFGCSKHGDVIKFEMLWGNMEFPEAVEQLAEMAGLEIPRISEQDRAATARANSLHEVLEKACAWFEQQLAGAGGESARTYLAGRGILPETIAGFRLGWAPGGGIARALGLPVDLLAEAGLARIGEEGGAKDMFRNRVMFPILDRRGRVIGFGGRVLGDEQPKYLNSPATVLFDKGAVLFGLSHARDRAAELGYSVAVEGYLDVVSMHQAGYSNVVAPLGTALTERQLEELWRLAPATVVCFDADGAGRRAAIAAADRALGLLEAGRSVRFARVKGGKDPDELLREGLGQVLEEAIATARPLVDVIWEVLKAKFPEEGPEHWAMFEQALRAAASRIPDPLTRSRMLGEFRRRLRWQLDDPPEIFIGRSTKNTAPVPGAPGLLSEWNYAMENARRLSVGAWLERKDIDPAKVEKVLGGIGQGVVKAVKGRYAANNAWADAPRPALWDYGDAPGRMILPEWEAGPGSRLIDLVAWDPRDGDLATRCGQAVVLNEAAVDLAIGFEARGQPHPVKVASHPLSWLRRMAAGENVILIVDWSRAWNVLAPIRQLDADTVELGEMLDDRIRPPKLHRPKIMVEGLG